MNGINHVQNERRTQSDAQGRARTGTPTRTAQRTPNAPKAAPRELDPRLQATIRHSTGGTQRASAQERAPMGNTGARKPTPVSDINARGQKTANRDTAPSRAQMTQSPTVQSHAQKANAPAPTRTSEMPKGAIASASPTQATASAPSHTKGTTPAPSHTQRSAATEAHTKTGASPAVSARTRTAPKKDDTPTETIIRLRGAVDRPFLVIVILLVCLGSAMVFSASYAYAEHHFGDSLYFIRSQIRWVAVGFVAMIAVMQFDYRWFQKLTMPAFFGTLGLLALVPFIGKTVKGAKRWIEIGPIQIQPSEMMKLALIMVLALYVAANRGQMKNFRNGIFYPYCIIGAVCFVTALERHLSATMILLMIGTLVIFIGGAPFKPIGIALGTGGGVVAILIAIFPYARRRVEYWLHPETDPGSAGYQLLQSLYAIGSGGALGVGLGNSRQKYLYLPESQNDFIFAIICEEFGWVGAAAVIILFGLLLWRGYVIATHAPDTYSSLLTMGIIAQIALQCIMNIAVVTGSMPVTGVSLPFFSYGGSSLIMLMAEAGMILAVSRYSYQTDKN